MGPRAEIMMAFTLKDVARNQPHWWGSRYYWFRNWSWGGVSLLLRVPDIEVRISSTLYSVFGSRNSEVRKVQISHQEATWRYCNCYGLFNWHLPQSQIVQSGQHTQVEPSLSWSLKPYNLVLYTSVMHIFCTFFPVAFSSTVSALQYSKRAQ